MSQDLSQKKQTLFNESERKRESINIWPMQVWQADVKRRTNFSGKSNGK
jgi:hypothetical protein